MLRAVKDEVLEKLKSKRILPERITESAAIKNLKTKADGS